MAAPPLIDSVYDLILCLQQALEDCVRFDVFATDARAAGDDELASFFDELSSSDREIAGQAKDMLRARLD